MASVIPLLLLLFTSTTVYAVTVVSIVNANLPTTGSSSLTIIGASFQVSPSLSVGSNTCAASVWMSSSTVVCKVPAGGAADGLQVAYNSGATSYALTFAASFDTLKVSDISPKNGPTLAAFSAFITGANFGAVSVVPSASLRNVACGTTTWISTSAILCLTTANANSAILGAANVAVQIPNRLTELSPLTNTFSFNRPTLSASNSPTTGGVSVTLISAGFGTTTVTVHSRLGALTAEAAMWVSDSFITTKLPSFGSPIFLALNNYIAVTVVNSAGVVVKDALAGSPCGFDAPVARDTAAIPSSPLPTSGGVSFTLIGVDFGKNKLTIGSRLAGTAAETSVWAADSSLSARSPAQQARKGRVIGSVAMRSATSQSLFQFANIVASYLPSTNGPAGGAVQGQSSLTVMGSEFGTAFQTLAARIGSTACESSSWFADSVAVCKVPGSSWLYSPSNAVAISAPGTVANLTLQYTYDAIYLTLFNVPTTGSAVVLVNSWGFTNSTPTIIVGQTNCELAMWMSISDLKCKTPGAFSGPAIVQVQIAQSHASVNIALSYDLMVASTISPANTATTGAISLSIGGVWFSKINPCPNTRAGATSMEAQLWISDTSIYGKAAQSPPTVVQLTSTIHSYRYSIASPLVYDTPPLVLMFLASTLELFDVDFFQSQLASIIDVPVSQIQVLSVAPASIRVTLRFLSQNWRAQYAAMLADLASDDSLLRTTLHVSSLEDFSTGVVVVPPISDSLSTDRKFQARITLAVISAGVGTAFIMILGFVIFVIYRAVESDRAKKEADRREAEQTEMTLINNR